MICGKAKRFTVRSLSLLVFIGTLAACSRSTAGLTIPAGQIFVLGEYMNSAYRASIRNRGDQPVTLALVRKSDGSTVRTLRIVPQTSESIAVPADKLVKMINAGAVDAQLLVEMNRGVEGMRLHSLDAPSDRQSLPQAEDPKAKGTSQRFSAEVAPDSCYVIGDGTETGYEATVRARGGQVALRVLTSDSNQWVRGFGLGAGSRETITVGRDEALYLCNESSRILTVKVRTSQNAGKGRMVVAAN